MTGQHYSANRAALRLVWVLIAAIPPIFALLTWNHDNLRPGWQAWFKESGSPVAAIEAVVVIALLALGARPWSRVRAWPMWVQYLLALVVIIALANAILIAPDRAVGRWWTSLSLLHLLLGIAFYDFVVRCAVPLLNLWRLVAIGEIAFVALCILFAATVDPAGNFHWAHFGLGGTAIRHTGFYAAVGAALAVGLMAVAVSWPERLAWGAAATVQMAWILWSGTRGAALGVAVALLLGTVLQRRLRQPWVLAGALLVYFAGAALAGSVGAPDPHYGLSRIGASAGDGTLNELTSYRWNIWAETVRWTLQRPWFGYGEGQLTTIVPVAYKYFAHHPHNALIQLAFQWGFVGAAATLALGARAASGCLKGVRADDPAAIPATLAGASLLVMSMYDGTLFFPYPTMIVALSLATVAAIDARSASRLAA